MSDSGIANAGFADPATDAAGTFRAMLEAMARPGRIQPLPTVLAAPAALGSAVAQLVLTLCDFDTPLWLDPAHATAESWAYLRFHAGCPVAATIEEAAFLVVAPANVAPVLPRCRIGTAEYPDRSATLIIPLDGIEEGSDVRLSGPGIEHEHRLSIAPSPSPLWPALIANQQHFPLGCDCFLAAPGHIAAIPRSTRIELVERG
jgi:alpha-D-ribose 1-methylphosphonate 5-triphosphate synthase subunit PhnH